MDEVFLCEAIRNKPPLRLVTLRLGEVTGITVHRPRMHTRYGTLGDVAIKVDELPCRSKTPDVSIPTMTL